jgi:diguanylate cyclase (GGDEF)-like protein
MHGILTDTYRVAISEPASLAGIVGVLLSFEIVDITAALTLAILVTTLLFVLAQSIHRVALEHWTLAWGAQALGLGILLAGEVWRGGWDELAAWAAVVALAISQAFLLLGCYSLRREAEVARLAWVLLPAAALLAALLPPTLEIFLPQEVPVSPRGRGPLLITAGLWQTMAAVLAAGLVILVQRRTPKRRTGLRVMVVALCVHAGLGLLAVAAAFILRPWPEGGQRLSTAEWVRIEGIAQILLAFGMIILSLEGVRLDLEKANRELTDKSARLARLAQSDAMTEALNRHAFYSLIESQRHEEGQNIGGALAILDLNDLKPLNDRHGHAAGDAAIRAVAKAVRSIVRPDDLLFRWGGDEFLVILPNVSAAEAQRRFERLHERLRGTELPGVPHPMDLEVSFGVAPFAAVDAIEQAVAQADAAMYAYKARRKKRPSDTPRPRPRADAVTPLPS